MFSRTVYSFIYLFFFLFLAHLGFLWLGGICMRIEATLFGQGVMGGLQVLSLLSRGKLLELGQFDTIG
jgi:hypothetical protein